MGENDVLNMQEIDKLLLEMRIEEFTEKYPKQGRQLLTEALQKGKTTGITAAELTKLMENYEKKHRHDGER